MTDPAGRRQTTSALRRARLRARAAHLAESVAMAMAQPMVTAQEGAVRR